MVKEKKIMQGQIEIEKGIEATLSDEGLKIKGPKGELIRKFINPMIKIEIKDNQITIIAIKSNKRGKTIIGTTKAHIKNMIEGCKEPYNYELKICSGHFPMTVTANKEEFIVKNFFGEKVPRVLKIKKGAIVKVEGEKVTVESSDKELCGQVSADIEKLTQRTAYDRRIFQDGIYITSKGGKSIK